MSQISFTASERPNRPRTAGDIGGGALGAVGEGLGALARFAQSKNEARDQNESFISVLNYESELNTASVELETSNDPNAEKIFNDRVLEIHQRRTQSLDQNNPDFEKTVAKMNAARARALSGGLIISSRRQTAETIFNAGVGEDAVRKLILSGGDPSLKGSQAFETIKELREYVRTSNTLSGIQKKAFALSLDKTIRESRISFEKGPAALLEFITNEAIEGLPPKHTEEMLEEVVGIILSNPNSDADIADVAGILTDRGIGIPRSMRKSIRGMFDPKGDSLDIEMGVKALKLMGEEGFKFAKRISPLAQTALDVTVDDRVGSDEFRRKTAVLSHERAQSLVSAAETILVGTKETPPLDRSTTLGASNVILNAEQGRIFESQYRFGFAESGIAFNEEDPEKINGIASERVREEFADQFLAVETSDDDGIILDGTNTRYVSRLLGLGTDSNPDEERIAVFNAQMSKFTKELNTEAGRWWAGVQSSKEDLRVDRAFRDGGNIYIPAIGDTGVVGLFEINPDTGVGTTLFRGPDFDRLSRGFESSTDRVDLSRNAHLRYRPNFGDKSAKEVSPAIHKGINKLAMQRWRENNGGRVPTTPEDMQELQLVANSIGRSYGWRRLIPSVEDE